jgi:hypothetical protein
MRALFDETRDAAPAQTVNSGMLPCLWCQQATKKETLVAYGARCFRCYEAYCAEGLKGGAGGFETGRPDTEQQAAMRRALRGALPRSNFRGLGKPAAPLLATDDLSAAELKRRQQDAQRKVDAALAATGSQQGQRC